MPFGSSHHRYRTPLFWYNSAVLKNPETIPDLDLLETVLAYNFKDRTLLERAITHRSWAHEKVAPGDERRARKLHNESLEFLGDSVLGLVVANYADTTIFDKLEETRPLHRLIAAAEAVQPWGSLEGRLVASSYLDDFSQNRLTFFGEFRIRIVRGLNFTVDGSYSRVRDQLSLIKAGLSDEDVLVRLKELKTDYRYFVSLGLSYTFGSKFNNVVNPRFSNSRGDCFGPGC